MNLVTLLLTTLMLPLFMVPTTFAQPTNYTELIVDTIGEPMDSDPAWSYDTASAEMLMNVYETLLWFNRTNMDSYVPILATEWTGEIISETSPEGLSWVNRWYFKIRENVRFHYYDGSVTGENATLTPADVEYSFERILLTDCSTGPAWMIFEPLTGGYWMGDVEAILDDLGMGSENVTTGWNTLCDEVIDHAIESNSTHVWFNLVMPYEPWLQIVAQQWGSILNKAWCLAHNDIPSAEDVGDAWVDYTDPLTSPLYSADPSAPGPNLDAALGTGPYMLDYWNKGIGNAWSVVKNDDYWRGWVTPYNPTEWGTPPAGGWIQGHVDRFTSNNIPEWSTRRLRFLGGVSDFCAVPREYMGQVENQPGIECIYPLPQLACTAGFMSYIVDDTSPHIGVVQANGTFNEFGAPPNMFNDTDTRLGFAHLFDYATYMYAAFLNESIAPVTPVVPGLTYYDASIGKAEEPVSDQRKEYGISFEPAGTLAYNMTLAVEYLQSAWGGQLWANGFTIDMVYNEGNTARLMACILIQDALNAINAANGTKFTTNIVSIPWSIYKLEWRARQLPVFIVGWLADYPDAHNFAHPFMHSTGAFSRWQGIVGVTAFPNVATDTLIQDGIATLDPGERQGNYTLIQQLYVDESPGWVLSQPTGRHWQRDWVQGWYYNPIYPGEVAYDIWKALDIGLVEEPIDLDVTSTITAVAPYLTNGMARGSNVEIWNNVPCNVSVTRLDSNPDASFVWVIIGLLRTDTKTNYTTAIDSNLHLMGVGSSVISEFLWNETECAGADYTMRAEVYPVSRFAYDSDTGNNDQDGDNAIILMPGDVNGPEWPAYTTSVVDGSDVVIIIERMLTTGPLEDLNIDGIVDGSDIVICIEYIPTSYNVY